MRYRTATPPFDRLDVDVAGPAGHAIGKHHVHQADDRALARLLRAGDLDLLVLELLDVEIATDALQQAVDHIALPVHVVEPLPDSGGRSEQHADLTPGSERQHLFGVDIEGVGRGHFEVGVGLADGHHVEPAATCSGTACASWDRPATGRPREPEPGGKGPQHFVVKANLFFQLLFDMFRHISGRLLPLA